MDLSNEKEFKYALHSGTNEAGEKANYYCHHCDLDIHGTDVGFVAAGTRYANGEVSRCPRCGEGNFVEWDEDEY